LVRYASIVCSCAGRAIRQNDGVCSFGSVEEALRITALFFVLRGRKNDSMRDSIASRQRRDLLALCFSLISSRDWEPLDVAS